MKSKVILASSFIALAIIAFLAGFASGKRELPRNIHFVDGELFYEGGILFGGNADLEKVYEVYRYITIEDMLIDGRIVDFPLKDIEEIRAAIFQDEDGVKIDSLKIIDPNSTIASTQKSNGRYTEYKLIKQEQGWLLLRQSNSR